MVNSYITSKEVCEYVKQLLYEFWIKEAWIKTFELTSFELDDMLNNDDIFEKICDRRLQFC